jgi:predicted CxxxxCH...CXXCH cytochrome family protein
MTSARRLLHRPFVAILVVATLSCSSSGSSGDDADDVEKEVATQDVVDPGPSAPEGCVYPGVFAPAGCDVCHGAPPDTATHPPNPWCWRCHGYVIDADYAFVQPALHKNGAVEVAVGCSSCHGWSLGVSPPQGLDGACENDAPGVGAHAAMRRGGPAAHHTGCNNCHVVPSETWAEGHIDGDGRAEVVFGMLATVGGAEPVWDGETCSNVYCHGATLTGGTGKIMPPSWRDTSRRAGRCGACHRLTDPEGDGEADCSACHPSSVDAERNILEHGTHLNGHIDLRDEE